MDPAHDIHGLVAFQLCEQLVNLIAKETAKAPIARHFKKCDQLNDAALDAASDVAEGFVRYYPKEFARFLDFAIGSLEEVRTRTVAAYNQQLLSSEVTSDVLNLWARSNRACRNLRAYLWTVKKENLPPRPNRQLPKLPKRRHPRPNPPI